MDQAERIVLLRIPRKYKLLEDFILDMVSNLERAEISGETGKI